MSADALLRTEAIVAAKWWRRLLAEMSAIVEEQTDEPAVSTEQADRFEAVLALYITRQMARDDQIGLATIIGIGIEIESPFPVLYQALADTRIMAYPIGLPQYHALIQSGAVHVIKPNEPLEQIFPTDQ